MSHQSNISPIVRSLKVQRVLVAVFALFFIAESSIVNVYFLSNMKFDVNEEMGARVIGATTTAKKNYVTVDYSKIAYYPNLKSKIGFATNIKKTGIEKAVDIVEPIGPGIICNNIEFDQWLKWPNEEPNQALRQTFTSPTDSPQRSRPVSVSTMPAIWLRAYEKKIGDKDISLLLQITGAEPPNQIPGFDKSAEHPPSTNIVASATFIGQFTKAANHAYPVLWSLWNEPGHALMGVYRGKDSTGTPIAGCVAGAVFDPSCEPFDAFKVRSQQERDKSIPVLLEMYKQYENASRQNIGIYSGFGGASFLGADFNRKKRSLVDNLSPLVGDVVYFKEFIDLYNKLPNPKPGIDYFTFNSFGGQFNLVLHGVSAALATFNTPALTADRAPIIFTQYAPRSLKVSDTDVPILTNAQGPLPMRVVTDELTDMVLFQEAADLQFVCHSYWMAGKYGVTTEDLYGNLSKGYRYHGLKMFAELPIMRIPIDFAQSGVDKKGVMGLAGINGSTAAVLLWNNSASSTVSVPLQQVNLPTSLASGQTTLTILDSSNPIPYTVTHTVGQNVSLPPNSVALLKTQRVDVSDPLLRRKALGISAKFLKTESFTNRIPVNCGPGNHIPGITRCGMNAGTYGFYDSVRSVAYLGTATTSGARNPKVLAVYENIPSKIYVNSNVYNQNTAFPYYATGSASVRLRFPTCPNQKAIVLSTATDLLFKRGVGVLDLVVAKVPTSCYKQAPTEIMFENNGLMPGAQTEMYISANQADADVILQSTAQMRSTIVKSNATSTIP